MSTKAIRDALTTALHVPALPYFKKFPNGAAFVKPDGATTANTPSNQIWQRVSFIFGSKDPLSLSQTDQQTLLCQVDTFIPKGSGDFDSWQIMDTLDGIFSRLSPITTADGTRLNVLSTEAGRTLDAEPWWQLSFTATIRVYVPKA